MPQSLDDHATRDNCDLVKSKLNSSTVSLAEEFDFEVVGHGGDFNWAQGHRTQPVKIVESQHDGIEHKNDRDVGEITSPYDSCSSSPAISLPSSPTVQKMVDPPECKVNVGTRGIVSKNRGIGITRKLATQKKKQMDSLPKKCLDRLRALRKPITDCLNAVAWMPYPFALYTTHVCFVAISIGLLFLLLVLFYRSLGNGKDQQIVIDQDFPVPTGIFTSNADITDNVPAIYTLLEGWDKPDDIVYRFRISATDSDGKPRRQGLDYVSAVVTLTSLSSKEKNMPILLRARDDADGSYTFAVSVPGSGLESVVVDIYAATRAQIEKAGLKHAAGIGYRIEGSPFVIRGMVVNEKEHGKDPYKFFDGKSPPVFVAWQYIQNVMPRIDYRDLKSKIHARVTDVTARVRADAQLLNDRVFDELIAAKENVAAFMKAAVENLEQLVGSDESEKGKGTKDTKNAVKKNASAAAIQNSKAEFGDGVKRTYGNAKTGLEWLAAKIFSTRGDTTRSETEPFMKKAQNGILKLGLFLEVQRKHIAEKTNAMGNELREKVESSFVGMEKCVRDSILAVRHRVVATFTKGEESSWMKFRRAFSTFPGGLF